jgi:DNA polymerase-3 subunit delta'
VIVDRADQLNVNAANALLKSLEEPTANTYFVMLANDLDRLLPTVISRCHVQRVASPSSQQARDWLQAYARNDNEIDSALHIARMSPLKAQQLLQENNAVGLPEIFQRLTQCASGQASVTQTARQLEKCDLAGEVIPVLHAGLRQAISLRMDAQTSSPQAVNDLATALLDKQWSIDNYFDLLEQCNKAVRLLGSSANPNPTLLLEDILIRLTLR